MTQLKKKKKKWAKQLNRVVSKGDMQMSNNHVKGCWTSLIIEKCKSKPQWHAISCWVEWLPSKSLQTINAGDVVQKREPFKLLVVMQTCTAKVENNVEIPLKSINGTAIWPSNPTAGHTHWGHQNWKRYVYPNVHHSTVYNSQDMETT